MKLTIARTNFWRKTLEGSPFLRRSHRVCLQCSGICSNFDKEAEFVTMCQVSTVNFSSNKKIMMLKSLAKVLTASTLVLATLIPSPGKAASSTPTIPSSFTFPNATFPIIVPKPLSQPQAFPQIVFPKPIFPTPAFPQIVFPKPIFSTQDFSQTGFPTRSFPTQTFPGMKIP